MPLLLQLTHAHEIYITENNPVEDIKNKNQMNQMNQIWLSSLLSKGNNNKSENKTSQIK